MGYGKRALQLLIQYYEGKIANLSEDTVPTTDQEIQPTELDEVRITDLGQTGFSTRHCQHWHHLGLGKRRQILLALIHPATRHRRIDLLHNGPWGTLDSQRLRSPVRLQDNIFPFTTKN